MDRSRIELFASQATIPARAIEGLTAAELNAFPIPATWSIQQIVVHLLESDLAATHRMRRIAAEEKPLIIAYDETLLSKNLSYEKMDVKLVTDFFRLNREFCAQWLRTAPDAAFAREGVHNHNGMMTLGGMLETYIRHVDNHMKHLREKRRLLNKPLAW